MSRTLVSDLDAIGRRHGASRSSLYKDLLRRYEPFLAPLRDEAFDLLEIGVGDGSSLRVWLDYFPNARIIGLDVRRVFVPDLPPRCRILHGLQGDHALLATLVRDYRFRVVIDDGSRNGAQQWASFSALFPALEPSGVYACEGVYDDSATALGEPAAPDDDEATNGMAWPLSRLPAGIGAGPPTPPDEHRLADVLTALSWGLARGRGGSLPEDRPAFASILRRLDSVAFLPMAVVATARGSEHG